MRWWWAFFLNWPFNIGPSPSFKGSCLWLWLLLLHNYSLNFKLTVTIKFIRKLKVIFSCDFFVTCRTSEVIFMHRDAIDHSLKKYLNNWENIFGFTPTSSASFTICLRVFLRCIGKNLNKKSRKNYLKHEYSVRNSNSS